MTLPTEKPGLLPCPFCGHENLFEEVVPNTQGGRKFIACITCFAQGPWSYIPLTASERWNSRPTDKPEQPKAEPQGTAPISTDAHMGAILAGAEYDLERGIETEGYKPAAQVEPAGHPYVSPDLDGEVRTPASAASINEPVARNAHPETLNCGFDRNGSLSVGHYVCMCGWEGEKG